MSENKNTDVKLIIKQTRRILDALHNIWVEDMSHEAHSEVQKSIMYCRDVLYLLNKGE